MLVKEEACIYNYPSTDSSPAKTAAASACCSSTRVCSVSLMTDESILTCASVPCAVDERRARAYPKPSRTRVPGRRASCSSRTTLLRRRQPLLPAAPAPASALSAGCGCLEQTNICLVTIINSKHSTKDYLLFVKTNAGNRRDKY